MAGKTAAVVLREEARAEAARRSLLHFAQRVSPWYETPAHVQYLAEQLEAVEAGKLKRLAICCPPGHGKSSLTQAFVAWFIGRDPKRRVLALSGNESLARRNSRAIRSMVQTPEWPFSVKLTGESLEEWYTTETGGVRAIGRNGQITGFRAELILVDDLAADAGTATSREDDEQWFREVMSTRLEPNGVVVLIATRWHEDDLVGRLKEGASRKQWRFINLPALAVENDPLNRAEGEALWPERWPVESLLERKTEVGSTAFSCQYQGAAVPLEGRMIQRSWFQKYSPGVLPRFQKIILGLDAASKTSASADNSAICVLGVAQGDSYVLDCIADKVEFVDLVRMLRNAHERWTTNAPDTPISIYVEDASAGTQLVQTLKRETTLPIIPVKTGNKSKEARVELLTPFFEAQHVLLPTHASWLGAFEEELYSFPASRHDDRVDAFAIACAQVVKKKFTTAIAVGDGYSQAIDSDGNVEMGYADVLPFGSGSVTERMMRIF